MNTGKCQRCARFCAKGSSHCRACSLLVERERQGQRVKVVTFIYTKSDGRKVAHFDDGTQTNYARLIAAVKIGRQLLESEVVHHLNGDKTDDRFSNLEVVSSQSEHMRLHDPAGLVRRAWEQRRPVCPGCGCAVTDRTRRCNPCFQRHYRFRKNGDARYKQATCLGCGVAHDERSEGCTTCDERFRQRAAA